jgi:O-acetyl-ADP-ribose deacetylase
MITTTQLIDEIRISDDKIIRLIKGDITDQNVDVIVNPANSY